MSASHHTLGKVFELDLIFSEHFVYVWLSVCGNYVTDNDSLNEHHI
jgi:hypothetical protein